MNPGLWLVDSKRGRGLACTFCYAGVVVVVMVTCQQSQSQGQRSVHLIRRSSGAQSPEVEAGVMGLPECIGRWRHTVTSHLLEATPGDQTGRWRHVSLASSNVRNQVAQRSGNLIPPLIVTSHLLEAVIGCPVTGSRGRRAFTGVSWHVRGIPRSVVSNYREIPRSAVCI